MIGTGVLAQGPSAAVRCGAPVTGRGAGARRARRGSRLRLAADAPGENPCRPCPAQGDRPESLHGIPVARPAAQGTVGGGERRGRPLSVPSPLPAMACWWVLPLRSRAGAAARAAALLGLAGRPLVLPCPLLGRAPDLLLFSLLFCTFFPWPPAGAPRRAGTGSALGRVRQVAACHGRAAAVVVFRSQRAGGGAAALERALCARAFGSKKAAVAHVETGGEA